MRNKGLSTEKRDALRQRAEKRARAKELLAPEKLENLSLEQTRALLLELQIHKVELEMQNDQLFLAQLDLEVARERSLDLYELAPVGYCTLSEAGVIVHANLTAANLLGISRQALIGEPITRFIYQHDQDIYYLQSRSRLPTAESRGCELRLLRTDQGPFWARLEIVTVLGDYGRPECRLVFSDISDRKQAEQALEGELVRRRIMFTQSPDIIMIIDPTTHQLLDFNPTAHQQLGYSREEFAQLGLAELSAAETLAAAEAGFAKVAAGGKAEHEMLLLTRDGATRPVLVTAMSLEFQGKPGCYWLCRDLSEQKRLARALAASEARFLALTDAAAEAILMLDPTGRIAFANPAAAQIFGYNHGEMIGMEMQALLGRQGDRDTVAEALALAALSNGGQDAEATAGQSRLSLQACRKDGHEIAIDLLLPTLPDQNGGPVLALIRDLSGRRRG